MNLINFEKYRKYVPFILRLSLGMVFLVFGLDKFFRPDYWVGWMPGWIVSFLPVDVNYFIYFQGVVEFFIGVFLILGIFIRITALVSILILGSIILILFFNPLSISHFSNLHLDKDIFSLLLNEILIRDLGLLAIAISVFFIGKGKFLSLDNKLKKS